MFEVPIELFLEFNALCLAFITKSKK